MVPLVLTPVESWMVVGMENAPSFVRHYEIARSSVVRVPVVRHHGFMPSRQGRIRSIIRDEGLAAV